MRNPGEIGDIIERVESALSNLPENDIFGESNQESRDEMELWLTQLEDLRDHQIIPVASEEVRAWWEGSPHSALNDFKE